MCFSRGRAYNIYGIVNEEMPSGRLSSLAPDRLRPQLRLTVRSTAGSMESFRGTGPLYDRTRPFCLLTVDSIFRPEEFREFIARFEADPEADGYMAVTSYVADEKPLYVATEPENDITGFLDHPPRTPATYQAASTPCARKPSDCSRTTARPPEKLRMRDYQRSLVAAGMRLKAWPFRNNRRRPQLRPARGRNFSLKGKTNHN